MKTRMLAIIGMVFSVAIGSAGWSAPATELEVTGNDMMRFSETELSVPAGKEVTLVFKNVGQLPKQAMGHNLVVLTPGSDVMAFGNAAMAHLANDYIPTDDDSKSKMVAHTKLLGPGETDTIRFTLPEPGEYPFLCSFPGHFAIMRGVIKAE